MGNNSYINQKLKVSLPLLSAKATETCKVIPFILKVNIARPQVVGNSLCSFAVLRSQIDILYWLRSFTGHGLWLRLRTHTNFGLRTCFMQIWV